MLSATASLLYKGEPYPYRQEHGVKKWSRTRGTTPRLLLWAPPAPPPQCRRSAREHLAPEVRAAIVLPGVSLVGVVGRRQSLRVYGRTRARQ